MSLEQPASSPEQAEDSVTDSVHQEVSILQEVMSRIDKAGLDDESQVGIIEAVTMVEMATASLVRISEELENEGVSQKDESKMILADYLRRHAVNGQAKCEEVTAEAVNDEAVEKQRQTRRKMLGIGALVGAVGITGGMAVSPKAHAFSDAAILMKQLVEMKKAYDLAKSQLSDIKNMRKDLFGGLEALHKDFANGITGMLTVNGEESTKQITAVATAADKIADTAVNIRKADNQLGSKPGSGTCTDDAASVANMALADVVDRSAKDGGAISAAAIDSDSTNSYHDAGGSAGQDLRSRNRDSFNGATILSASVSTNGDSAANSGKVYERLVQQPATLIMGGAHKISQTSSGKRVLAEVARRQVRRSLAEGVLNRLQRSQIREGEIYGLFKKNLARTASLASNPPSAQGDTSHQIDLRMVTLAQDGLTQLNQIAGGEGAISQMESFAFQVYQKSSPTFHEYVRSTGDQPAPLLRELISMQSLDLTLNLEILKVLRDQSALQATLLMETMDSPDRITQLNALREGR